MYVCKYEDLLLNNLLNIYMNNKNENNDKIIENVTNKIIQIIVFLKILNVYWKKIYWILLNILLSNEIFKLLNINVWILNIEYEY